jgi:Tfp pilus assembly protein PilX
MGKQHNARGFTLIAALLIMVLLSAVAIGLVYLVTNEGQMSRNEQEDNVAYYAAESGIEKLTADLSALYENSQNPLVSQIQNLQLTSPPSSSMVSNITYTELISFPNDPTPVQNAPPPTTWNTVSSGDNQGLYAEIVPITLNVNATRPTGASVNITRNVEVALIPVFQFGVFCGFDCSYFPGPNFSFGGRVHTNGSLFLAVGNGTNLVFNDKISAYRQIVMDELENENTTGTNYTGTVYVSTATGGCPLNGVFPPAPSGAGTNCLPLPASANAGAPGDASWTGGYPTVQGSANNGFPTVSAGTLNHYFVNSLTGATNLQLPFVKNSCTSNPPPCTDPIAIIRRPIAGESPNSTLGESRLFNKAQMRILLADTEPALILGTQAPLGDPDDIQFTPNTSVNVASAQTTSGGAAAGAEFFGMAQPTVDANWTQPKQFTTPTVQYSWLSWPLLGEITTSPANNAALNQGQGAWLRVEYKDAGGNWHGVTRQWLGYGFGRMYNTALTTPAGGAGQNKINPNAILILQQLRSTLALPASPVGSATIWYPINFYDAREGEMRDNANGCAVNGIMNAVELDVGNLALWLRNAGNYGGGNGTQVDFIAQNGYVLYYSDRRGMLPSQHPSNGGQTPAGVLNGESGLEDSVNWTQPLTSTTPDGVLEANSAAYYTYSPEDVDQNGFLDNWGASDIGNGFNVNTSNLNPYQTIASCPTTGLANAVTGARHVLKLVDGSLGNVPVRSDGNGGGFTVASENPVYIRGDYNSSAADPFWANQANNTTPHSAASVIGDAVTVLSNNWSDTTSLNNPTTPGNRPAVTTYYRTAIAGGKNIPFQKPTWANVSQDFGTDGGMHNFLRYLEGWGVNGGTFVNYNGSLVSMYYSEYNTGTFKCCTTVYGAPSGGRKYYFDTLFLNPANLPPGTPMFQDIVNLSYRQNFQPQ